MMFQRSIVECFGEDDVDELMEHLAGTIPFFTNPLIAANVLATLRKLVAEKEGGTTEKKMLPEVTKFLDSLKKKYPDELIIIDFWGLGCGPCKAGMLRHRELVEKYAGKVRFVYVCDEPSNPEAEVNKFFTENNIKGENVRVSPDMWKMLSHDFKFTGIPHLEILLKDGTIMEEGSYHINDDFIKTLLDK
jgi:thiol-disulfide isomerase/thioredoxin